MVKNFTNPKGMVLPKGHEEEKFTKLTKRIDNTDIPPSEGGYFLAHKYTPNMADENYLISRVTIRVLKPAAIKI